MVAVLDELLVVDDDTKFRGSVKTAFEGFGFDVTAIAPEQLEEVWETQGVPGAALIDLLMPGRDGVDVAIELRDLDPDIVLMFLSGQLNPTDFEKRAAAAGLNIAKWFTKPIPGSRDEAAAFFADLRLTIARQRFHNLAERWRAETALVSSTTKAAMHRSYQQIIGMGASALPFIIQELRGEPEHWFWALIAITGQDPTSPEDAGNLTAMREAWLRWAERRGL